MLQLMCYVFCVSLIQSIYVFFLGKTKAYHRPVVIVVVVVQCGIYTLTFALEQLDIPVCVRSLFIYKKKNNYIARFRSLDMFLSMFAIECLKCLIFQQ